MHKNIFVLALFLTILSTHHVQAADFLETFDGKPSAPQPFTQTGQTTWDVSIHSRNIDTWDKMVPFSPHHGPDCGPPLTSTATVPYSSGELVTHPWDGTYEQAVYKCSDHVMTALNGIGHSINDSYALAVLTPNQIVDFTNGEATIRWNMTTFRTTQRDWVDVWITPYDENLALPFDTGDVDLQGEPRNTVVVSLFAPNDNTKSGFRPKIIKNGTSSGEFDMFTNEFNWYTNYEEFLPGKSGDPKRRDTFELKLSKNHLSICMPQDSTDNAPSQTICWANKTIGQLPFTKGIVQFAHHSYTPNKDCHFYTPLICGPDTWHWDDIFISPAIPFTMIKADRRMVTSESTPVTFSAPAPANAKLRFSAAGNVSLSFNNGTFQSVQKQPSVNPSTGRAASFFVPIPQGTTNVRFRLTEGGVGGVHAKDFAIWSQNTPVNTPTSIPVTSTPTTQPIPTTILKVGDANGDGLVNGIDYITWLNHYNQVTTNRHVDGDFDGSGKVDGVDYLQWLTNYGK